MAELSRARADLATANTELANSRKSAEAANTERDSVKARVTELEGQLSVANSTLARANADNASLRAQVEDANKKAAAIVSQAGIASATAAPKGEQAKEKASEKQPFGRERFIAYAEGLPFIKALNGSASRN
jgi:septal ring factor EnvC (AmiA/AmiB activator)